MTSGNWTLSAGLCLSWCSYCCCWAPRGCTRASGSASDAYCDGDSVKRYTVPIPTSMRLKSYTLDAFTSHVFGGNPAAVCPLAEWLDDATMQCIAAENNLSETA